MPSVIESNGPSSRGTLTWRPTKMMNMRDLSKDDDFLSHLLVEKLGTGSVPLLVHKMDSSRKLPKTDADDLLRIVRRLVTVKGLVQHATRQAVDELLFLSGIRYYLKSYTQQQINAFATHASRYLELYHPSGSIEIAHTSRYSHRTGKSELCILATRNLVPGTVITELKGSMANLTDEEDRELKRTDRVRRDFSVIHSKQMKKNHLFLGPARFVNHDCENNCELFREGRYITFRVIKPISIGEEITAHYGDGYFGRKNRHCLCQTCEKRGRGGYAPENAAGPSLSTAPSDSDTDSDDSDSDSDSDEEPTRQALDERRTRRGVYAVVTRKEGESSESEGEDDGGTIPLANAKDVPEEREMELAAEAELSELTSLTPSSIPTINSAHGVPQSSQRSSSSLSSAPSEASGPNAGPLSKAAPNIGPGTSRPMATPPINEASRVGRSATHSKRVTRSASAATFTDARDKGKGRAGDGVRSASIISGVLKDKGKGKEDIVNVKREEPEARVLRTRPQPSFGSKDTPAKSTPLGPDGKPLPTCCTCQNVLPVISVDSKIVWGLDIIKNKKKNSKVECPRCMRHFAIYMQPWPCRLIPPGSSSSSLPTPREEDTPVENTNRRVSQKALPVIDRKLAAAASSLGKHKPGADAEEGPRPRKKQKPDSTSSRAQKESASQDDKRKRRPRIKQEEDVVQLLPEVDSTLTSKRKGNDGRRKPNNDSPHVRSRRMEDDRNGTSTRISLRIRKRVADGDSSMGQPPNKKAQMEEDWDELVPMQKLVPRPLSSFPGGKLFGKPTPLTFATRAWANLVVLDDLSSEDEKAPITPEDGLSPPPLDTPGKNTPADVFPCPTWMRGALTLKPSPLTYARRRWAPASVSGHGVDVHDDDVRSSESYGNNDELSAHYHDALSVSRSQDRWAAPYGYATNELELASTPDSPLDELNVIPKQYPLISINDAQNHNVTLMHHAYPGFGQDSTGRLSRAKVSFLETPPHLEPQSSLKRLHSDSPLDVRPPKASCVEDQPASRSINLPTSSVIDLLAWLSSDDDEEHSDNDGANRDDRVERRTTLLKGKGKGVVPMDATLDRVMPKSPHAPAPSFGPDLVGRFSRPKVSFPETPPHFVHAGWDSCSDISEV